jgi:hypothetical protein
MPAKAPCLTHDGSSYDSFLLISAGSLLGDVFAAAIASLTVFAADE